jgi:hypothetical protein
MKEKFKKYLSKKYADSTVNSYLSGINHLSQNYGQDIFRVTDLNKVVEILHLYDLGGAKRPVGDYCNGSARNGIVQYHNFIKSRSRNEIEEDFIKPETISVMQLLFFSYSDTNKRTGSHISMQLSFCSKNFP